VHEWAMGGVQELGGPPMAFRISLSSSPIMLEEYENIQEADLPIPHKTLGPCWALMGSWGP
jgi:hypothetical protein